MVGRYYIYLRQNYGGQTWKSACMSFYATRCKNYVKLMWLRQNSVGRAQRNSYFLISNQHTVTILQNYIKDKLLMVKVRACHFMQHTVKKSAK